MAKAKRKHSARKPVRKPARRLPRKIAKEAARASGRSAGKPAGKASALSPSPIVRRRRNEKVKSKTVLLRGPRVPMVRVKGSEKPLSAAEIRKYQEQLLERRDDLIAIVQRKKEQEIGEEESEIGDEADVATRSVEKDILFELTDSEKQTLEKVEAALRRIEKGVYGRCEYCQRPVGRMRIDAMPWARYCIECQARQESPVEPL